MSFVELKLSQPLLRAVESCRFQNPTEIQSQAIPIILAGHDLMASAQTGTGKTAAFVLPILERLKAETPTPGRGPRCLVLTPTRELAAQIGEDIRKLGQFCRPTFGTIIGGVSYGPQERLLSRPLDILVATPGRLMDHMQSGRVDFSRLKTLVLDEADRMLDLGFIDAMRTIVAATPATRQTLLFSATLEGKVLRIAEEMLNRPQRVQLAGARERHALIQQRIHGADDAAHKRRLLDHHLQSAELTQALIFTATKRRADKLASALSQDGHCTAALHGDMRQGRRRSTLESLRRGTLKLLVATDVAARGLDIKGMSHVINFDMPMVAEDYIHRIGRTGRAGATGMAISLVGPDDWDKLADIERLTGHSLEREIIPGLEPKLAEPHISRNRAHQEPSRFKSRRRYQTAKPRGASGRRFGRPDSANRGTRDASAGGFGSDRPGRRTAQRPRSARRAFAGR